MKNGGTAFSGVNSKGVLDEMTKGITIGTPSVDPSDFYLPTEHWHDELTYFDHTYWRPVNDTLTENWQRTGLEKNWHDAEVAWHKGDVAQSVGG